MENNNVIKLTVPLNGLGDINSMSTIIIELKFVRDPEPSKDQSQKEKSRVDPHDSDVENNSVNISISNPKRKRSVEDASKFISKASDEEKMIKKIKHEPVDKQFFEIKSENEAKTGRIKGSSSLPVKMEKLSPPRFASQIDPNVVIDLTRFKYRPPLKKIDLQKDFDKRSSNIAGPSSAYNRKSTIRAEDEDKDLILTSTDSEGEKKTVPKRRKRLTALEDRPKTSSNETSDEEEQIVKKISKNSFERDYKKFFEIESEDEAMPGSQIVKKEKFSPPKFDRSFDLSGFEDRLPSKKLDLHKDFDKRSSNIAGPSSAYPPSTDSESKPDREKKAVPKRRKFTSALEYLSETRSNETSDEEEQKKKIKQNSFKGSSSQIVKKEKFPPPKFAKKFDPTVAIDLTGFESRLPSKKIDLQKVFEKRSSNVAGPSSAYHRKSTIRTEDEGFTLTSTDSESESDGEKKQRDHSTASENRPDPRKARREEYQRLKRLQKKHDALSTLVSSQPREDGQVEVEVILDCDPKSGVTIKVHPKLVGYLKEHQREGIKFMYDNVFGSISDNVETKSGCILAHCMGLGKTLQIITLVHTIIQHPERLKTQRILILCPKSTILNWDEEFGKWLEGIDSKGLDIYYLGERFQSFHDRVKELERWHNSETPGVFLMNYEAFRNLVFYQQPKKSERQKNPMSKKTFSKLKERILTCLVSPGPDLAVCDEGHIIKNRSSSTYEAVAMITTKRKIILTGTPVQNNLDEYYTMVDWVKPSLLGNIEEFRREYANPIKKGQHKDSKLYQIQEMKECSWMLHQRLLNFVQRKPFTILREFLPDKFEYCLFVPLTEVQEELYETYLKMSTINVLRLFADYTMCRKVWTHPRALQNADEREITGQLKLSDKILKNMYDDEDSDTGEIVNTNEKSEPLKEDKVDDEDSDKIKDENDTSAKGGWWKKFVSDDDLESLYTSNKLILLFEILKMCEQQQEKCLIFSSFTVVLDVVENFMKKIHYQDGNPNKEKYGYSQFKTTWLEGSDYVRLDGSTPFDVRHELIKEFNKPNNPRLRCFLISARAGGQGINLIGANRCIILDTSWNPSSDQQNIFRIFRLGQRKNCYIYRLVAQGTMEDKIYSRSVTKQALSKRVVDKHQVDRHYNEHELADLYVLTKTDYSKWTQPPMPCDNTLKYLLENHPLRAFNYHIHDSLLENKPELELTEDEIAQTWARYKKEMQRKRCMEEIDLAASMIGEENKGLIEGDVGKHFPVNQKKKKKNRGHAKKPYRYQVPNQIFPSISQIIDLQFPEMIPPATDIVENNTTVQ